MGLGQIHSSLLTQIYNAGPHILEKFQDEVAFSARRDYAHMCARSLSFRDQKIFISVSPKALIHRRWLNTDSCTSAMSIELREIHSSVGFTVEKAAFLFIQALVI